MTICRDVTGLQGRIQQPFRVLVEFTDERQDALLPSCLHGRVLPVSGLREAGEWDV